MTMNKITITMGDTVVEIVPGNTSWGSTQGTYKITTQGEITEKDGSPLLAMGSLNEILERANLEQIPVMVQEFGVFNKTPHDVTLAYLTDVVTLFNTHQIGYTLWNLSGSFGILDSERSDCDYTSYRGKQLDQTMTNILQGN